MKTATKRKPIAKPGRRVADDITAGLKEIAEMFEAGKTAEQMQFTVRTIEIPDPAEYSPRDVLRLRQSLGVSQAVFAKMIGVSTVLVQSWEAGKRLPASIARRLLDTIAVDPAAWLATVQLVHQHPKRRAG